MSDGSATQLLTALAWSSLGLYGLAALTALVQPRRGRALVALGALVHLALTVGRGWRIGFFPLTNKFESFSAAALALATVTTLSWLPARAYLTPLLTLTLAALGAALRFPQAQRYAPPLMHTIWYPLHVPLSFFGYATWAAAAASAVAWLADRDPLWLRRIDRLALQGFGLWSASMIFGGIWGVVAWGAYFLWDPKVIWSVVLWFHYATLVHVRLTPALRERAWVRPALALVGLVWIFVAYVGTSFLFGRSSHAF